MTRNPGPRKRGRGLAVALLSALSAPAVARDPVAPPCVPDGGETVRVAAVAGDLSIRLADGRTLLVAGIDPVRATAAHPALTADARVRLETWLGGRDAVIRPLSAAADRWGRWPALVFAGPRAGDPPTLSVALALVDAGFARARPDPAAHACWIALLAAESAARDAGLGLWSDPYYAVRDASEAGKEGTGLGTLTLVQGRVTRVRGGRSWTTIGLNGPEADFSVRLGKRDVTALASRGLGPDRLRGLRVRVRGLLDDRFGPGLDGVDADGIEVLDAVALPADAATAR